MTRTADGQGQTTGSAVRGDDLSLGYSRRPGRPLALAGVTFDIPRGGILGVVGEAGSGKSTLAKAVAGQIAGSQTTTARRDAPIITGGSLDVLGDEVRDMSRRVRDALTLRVGFLPQDGGSSLAPRLTVGENVAEPIYLRDRRFDRLEAGAAVASLIDSVRLPLSVMEKYPHELSRGQRQRVALARALVLEPSLLVADDPTMGVDVLVRGRILTVIADLQREREFSALIVGHDLRELRSITDRILILHGGGVVGIGLMDEVLRDPTHPYVAALAEIYA